MYCHLRQRLQDRLHPMVEQSPKSSPTSGTQPTRREVQCIKRNLRQDLVHIPQAEGNRDTGKHRSARRATQSVLAAVLS